MTVKKKIDKSDWVTVCHNAPQIAGWDEFDRSVLVCGVCSNIVGRETKLIKPI